jgi:cobaltochelatase CobT
MVFKGFDTPLKGVRGRFMSIQGHGSNVDGESVAWAARRLAARPEKRKILVVISDGRPATMAAGKSFHETWRILQDHLRYVVKSITSSGIEVIGIGAGTAEPAAYYNNETGAKFVHVENVHTMAVDIYRVMKARVTKGAA